MKAVSWHNNTITPQVFEMTVHAFLETNQVLKVYALGRKFKILTPQKEV